MINYLGDAAIKRIFVTLTLVASAFAAVIATQLATSDTADTASESSSKHWT